MRNNLFSILCGLFFFLITFNFSVADEEDKLSSIQIIQSSELTIKTLLKRNKYKIIDISTPGQLDVDIVKEKISEKNIKIKLDYFYEKILNDSELSKNFQNFLSDNSLSSNMWVVATI